MALATRICFWFLRSNLQAIRLIEIFYFNTDWNSMWFGLYLKYWYCILSLVDNSLDLLCFIYLMFCNIENDNTATKDICIIMNVNGSFWFIFNLLHLLSNCFISKVLRHGLATNHRNQIIMLICVLTPQ